MSGRVMLAALLAVLLIGAGLTGVGVAAASQHIQAPVYAAQSLPEMNVTWSTLNGTTTINA
ncbi:MAG: hypothetical protein QXZ14_00030, partial [Candidatus Jordarchaeales archaeon]